MAQCLVDPAAVKLSGFEVVRISLGAVLLVAAGLKGYHLATTPVVESSLFGSSWLMVGLIEFECFLALWLLSRTCIKASWWTCLVCFAAFSCASWYKVLNGEASCGCFGRIDVNPWFPAILDTVALLSLVQWRPCVAGTGTFFVPLPSIPQFSGVIIACIALGGIVVSGMTMTAVTTLVDSGEFAEQNGIVILEPMSWAHKPLPLLQHIDIGATLSEGEWIVVLYHHDCAKCQAVLKKYDAISQELATSGGTRRIAVVEMPPFGVHEESLEGGSFLVRGRLDGRKQWFVETPTELFLSNSVVLANPKPSLPF